MKNISCDSIDLFQYIAGDADETDKEAITAHVTSCAFCRSELRDLEGMFDVITDSLVLETPPANLRSETLAAAFSLRAPAPQQEEASKQVPTLMPRQRSRVEQPLNHRNKRSVRSRFIPIFSAVALFAVSVGLTAQVLHDKSEIATLHKQVANQVSTMNLQPTAFAKQAKGQLLLMPSQNQLRMVVYVTHMVPTSGQQIYHVWLWKDGQRTSAGLLSVDASGSGTFETTLTGAKMDFNAIGITLEPNPNTIQPQGPKVLGVSGVNTL